MEWTNGEEEAGNAQVLGHSVFRRRVHDLNTTCNATDPATATVALTCTRASGTKAEYEVSFVIFTVTFYANPAHNLTCSLHIFQF